MMQEKILRRKKKHNNSKKPKTSIMGQGEVSIDNDEVRQFTETGTNG
jgi:hypothetical protein